MATNRAELSNINEVMHFYENAEGENYKIYAKSTLKDDYIRYSYNGNKEEGIAQLSNDLNQINRSDNYMDYLLSVSSINRKGIKPDMVNITFQLNKPQYLGAVNNYQQNNPTRTEMLLEKLVEQNQMLVSRVSKLETEEDFEEEEEPETGLAGILKNPEVQSMLIGAIGRFIQGNTAAPAAIAGIPKEESDNYECIEILDSLMQKGVTIDHLRSLNKMSVTKLNNLLLML
jgi:hypothetical protein